MKAGASGRLPTATTRATAAGTTAANPSICTDTYRRIFHLRLEVFFYDKSVIPAKIKRERVCALVIGCAKSRYLRLEGAEIFLYVNY